MHNSNWICCEYNEIGLWEKDRRKRALGLKGKDWFTEWIRNAALHTHIETHTCTHRVRERDKESGIIHLFAGSLPFPFWHPSFFPSFPHTLLSPPFPSHLPRPPAKAAARAWFICATPFKPRDNSRCFTHQAQKYVKITFNRTIAAFTLQA